MTQPKHAEPQGERAAFEAAFGNGPLLNSSTLHALWDRAAPAEMSKPGALTWRLAQFARLVQESCAALAHPDHGEALMRLSQFAHTAAKMPERDMRNNLSDIAEQLITLSQGTRPTSGQAEGADAIPGATAWKLANDALQAEGVRPCRHGHIHCLACMNNRALRQIAALDSYGPEAGRIAREALALYPVDRSQPVGGALTDDDIKRARQVLARLCDHGLLTMSIPVDHSRDEDMLLSRVIDRAASAPALQAGAGEGVLRALLRRWQQAYNAMDRDGVILADMTKLRRDTHAALSGSAQSKEDGNA